MLVHLTLTINLEGHGQILFSMAGYFDVHVNINSLRPIVIMVCTMTWTLDLKGHFKTLLTIIDHVGTYVKINASRF